MKLDFLTLDKLTDSKANMRSGRKEPDVADILPSVRARGVLVPLIVRPGIDADTFEVVAGRRRRRAAILVAEETGHAEPVPCAIIEPGDDAAALEASMLENMARLDPGEVKQWESFTALVKKGRSVEDIAATFGLPEPMIKRVLALGNLLPRIRDLYRRDEIDGATVRHLTMATKAKQQEWLALRDDPDTREPIGGYLKSWLLGGQTIATTVALFDLADYPGLIVTTLFGDDAYFGDAQAFWTAQNAAIEARRLAYLDAGWGDVTILEEADYFRSWEYEKTAKRKGGGVFIEVRASGEVVFHEGYLSSKEAKKRERAEAGGTGNGAKIARPEVSSTMQTYVDLHRHAAVRADLLHHPGIALRMMVAHAIAGSHLWRVHADPRTSRNDEVTESAESCHAEASFDAERRAVLALLAMPDDELSVTGFEYSIGGETLPTVFLRLLPLPDEAVMRIMAVVMGETLAAGSAAVEVLGETIGIDMANWWEADAAFFDCLRDREVLTRMVAEVAGETVAKANAGEKTKTLKGIVTAHLEGADGRTKVERWVPRWMRFAPSAYTERGGVPTVKAYAKVEEARAALAAPEPEADAGPEGEEEAQRLAA